MEVRRGYFIDGGVVNSDVKMVLSRRDRGGYRVD